MTPSRICTAAVVVLTLAAAALTTSLATAPPARTAAPAGRVAVCDVVEVFNNYQRAKDLTARLNERRNAIKAESDKRSKAIEALQMELEGLKKGSEKYEQTFNEIQRLSIEHKAYLQYQDALALRDHQNLTKDMYEEITAMIARLARERGFDVVVQREGAKLDAPNTTELLRQIYDRKLLYASEGVDLTETVLLALNQAYRARRPASGPGGT